MTVINQPHKFGKEVAIYDNGFVYYETDLIIEDKLIKTGDTIYVKDRYDDNYHEAIFVEATEDKDVYATLKEDLPNIRKNMQYWRYAKINT